MTEAHWAEHRAVGQKHGLLLEEPSHAASVQQSQTFFEGSSPQTSGTSDPSSITPVPVTLSRGNPDLGRVDDDGSRRPDAARSRTAPGAYMMFVAGLIVGVALATILLAFVTLG